MVLYKKSMKRLRPRKSRKRSSGAKRRKSSIIRKAAISNFAFPSSKFVKMCYFDTIALTQTAGTGVVQQFRLNSLYDFDYTNVGHQPYYYDQLTPMYATYRVYGVKIDYEYTCDSGAGVPLESQIVFRATPDGTTPTASPLGFAVESERPFSLNRMYSSGGQPCTGTLKYSCRQILGMSKGQYNDDDKTAAAVTTNPATVPYLNVVAISTAASSVHLLRVKATFFCKFFNRVIVSQS